VELALRVKVYDVTIPEHIHFNPELNTYRGPGEAGSAQFKDSFRLAHYHTRRPATSIRGRLPTLQSDPGELAHRKQLRHTRSSGMPGFNSLT
jgi:hypothetical protein